MSDSDLVRRERECAPQSGEIVQILEDLTINPRAALEPAQEQQLKTAISASAQANKSKLEKIKRMLEGGAGANGPGCAVEVPKADPAQRELNLQLALTRLVQSPEEQRLAQLDGEKFQLKYNLSNEQMWTLCRLAVELGMYEDTDDMKDLLSTIDELDQVVMSLSPDAIKRLGLSKDLVLVGSCSCCCP
jgi:hypothetical protein